MNIMFISPNSPFESIGGVERYLVNLIDYYSASPDSKVFLVIPTTQEGSTLEQGKVTIIFDKNLYLSRNSEKKRKDITQKATLFVQGIEKLVKEQHIDIICAENFHVGLPPVYSLQLNMLSKLCKVPLILQMHSFASTDLQNELINHLMWSRISCVSKSVTGDCFQKGADIDDLSTHYLGVNTREFNALETSPTTLKEELNLSNKTKIILTATRILLGKTTILQQKGVINLIQAFSKLVPLNPNLILLLAIGKPPNNLQQEFEQAIEMLQGYIKLHHVQSQTIIKMFDLDEMPKVYKGSDVFVLASENETFGQVIIEAMACGLPVIGSKVGGIPEIISDSTNGFLVRPNDSSILAQKIDQVLKDPTIREKFAEEGLKTVVEKFTCKKQFLDFQKMLEDVYLQA